VPGLEQLFQELFGIAHVAAGDPLLELPHVAGELLDERLEVVGKGRLRSRGERLPDSSPG